MKHIASKIFLTGAVLGIALSAFGAHSVLAKKTLGDAAAGLQTVTQKTGITEGQVTTIVGEGIAALLTAVGLLFFALMVYAGIKWMVARGNEEEVTKARNTIIAAVIGLLITISAYAITNFVENAVIQGGTNNPLPDNPNDPNVSPGEGNQGCCISWTQGSLFVPSISSWKIMSQESCKFANTSIAPPFEENENKFATGACPASGNAAVGCWLFYEGWDASQCKAEFDKY